MRKFLSLALIITFILSLTACADAAKKSKVKFRKSQLKKIELVESLSHGEPMIVLREDYSDVPIMGEAVASEAQMINYINKRNPDPKINCSVEHLVHLYYVEAGREGIRPDIALCQSIKETGVWAYGGDVVPEQNNYCGLGTTGGGVKGAYFATPQMGVRAHIQHLLAYTSKNPPKVAIVDPRYELIQKFRPQIFGQIKNWTGLNGVWAVPGKQYGQDILNLWQQAQLPDASDASLEYANSIIEKDFDTSANYVYRGLVYFLRQDYWNAQTDFKTALEINPELSEAVFNLALTQEKLNRPKDALKTYDRYLQLQPKSKLGYYNRGNVYLNQKKYNDAIKDFRRSLEIEDRFVDAHNQIALAYFRQKKYQDALKEIRHAAEVNTTNKIVNENKAALEACIKK